MNSIPDFKQIPGTKFTVDGFKFPNKNVQAYFLTHAHSGAWPDREATDTSVVRAVRARLRPSRALF
jgi:hypothetical protein